SAFSSLGGPAELRYVPRDAGVLAYANVHEIMTSELRQRVKAHEPMPAENGQRQFQDQTSINIQTDIDRVGACLEPPISGTSVPSTGLVVASGRFDQVKIEALMRDHGAQVETYKGRQLLSGDPHSMHRSSDAADSTASSQTGSGPPFALAFRKPGVVAV